MENVENIISSWAKEQKLSNKQQKPLLEAYRRIFLLKGERASSELDLPCSPSVINPVENYFIRPERETPRVYNWYQLSTFGFLVVNELHNALFQISDKDDLNLYLFNRV